MKLPPHPTRRSLRAISRRAMMGLTAAAVCAASAEAQPLLTGVGAMAGGMAITAASILDKSATLARVGTLTGVSGTPLVTSQSNAGWFFTAVNAVGGYDLLVGLSQPDRGVNTAPTVTITDNAGAHTLTLSVAAPASTATPASGSVWFNRRNGATGGGTRKLTGTTSCLANFFGNGTTAASGSIFFFCKPNRGAYSLTANATDMGLRQPVLATVTENNPRGFQCYYFGNGYSSSPALRNRFCFAGKDNASGGLGNYAAADADGSPSGIDPSRYIRSAKILDGEPRLVVLDFNASTKTMTVYTIKMDGTVETGDTITSHTWVGFATSANALNLGYDGSSTTEAHYFSGYISHLVYATTSNTSSNYANIGKGRAPETELGSGNIKHHWALTDVSGSPLTSTGATGGITFTASTTGSIAFRQGPMLSGAYDGSDGIACYPLGDAYTEGVERRIGGSLATSSPLRARVNVYGASCNVEARVRRTTDGAVIADWAQIGASISGAAELATAAIAVGFDYAIDVRRADKPSLAVNNNERHRVGVSVEFWGQSQLYKAWTDAASLLTPDTAPTVSFAYMRGNSIRYTTTDIGLIDNAQDLSDGAIAFAERCKSIAPFLPVHVRINCVAGTAISDWTGNTDQSTANGGAGYLMWGDYTTPFSGMVTDLWLEAGARVTAHAHFHGTSDLGTGYQTKMQALYQGTGANAGVRSFTGFSPPNNLHVLMFPHPRYIGSVSNTPYSTGWKSTADSMSGMRKDQATWAPSGMSFQLGGWVNDMRMLSSAELAHQTNTDRRGDALIGYRMAAGVLGTLCGLTTYSPAVTIAGVARTSSTVLTVTVNLPNGGSLINRAGTSAVAGFEVDENSGTWTTTTDGGGHDSPYNPIFTAAIASANTITLTRNSGSWAAAASLRVRYHWGYPYNYGSSPTSRAVQFANEQADMDLAVYESRSDMAPDALNGNVQGVPLAPTYTDITPT